MEHKKFSYRTYDDVLKEEERLGVFFPMTHVTNCLKQEAQIGTLKLNNRLGTAPMEGNDACKSGEPSPVGVERYVGLAEGGAALLWMEAVAVVEEGRSSLGQLWINDQNLDAFKRFVDTVKEAGMKKNGFAPAIVMQANHSGRYAKPKGTPAPLIAYHHPVYEKEKPLDDSCIVSDDYLKRLEEAYGHAAVLCRKAGFDAMDVKSCHGYLFAEMASAYTRPGNYGGSFENRFRLLLNSIRNAKAEETEQFQITSRVGIYDGFAYPYGFGVGKDGSLTPDYSEPLRLIGILHKELGLKMVNITMGNPYQDSHVTRPFDHGKYLPPEHPFEGVARMYEGTRVIKQAYPDLFVSASAPSYLRQFSPNLAAGSIEQGVCDMVLFGRESFANPGFANEILQTGGLDLKHVCVTCGKCGDLIRAGLLTGCVVRNPQKYLPYYRTYMERIKESK